MIVINPQAPNMAHSYELGVQKDGQITTIEVNANARSQARRIAEDAGYTVRDVNMTG